MNVRKEYVKSISIELINLGKEYGVIYSYFIFSHLGVPLDLLHDQLQEIYRNFLHPELLIEDLRKKQLKTGSDTMSSHLSSPNN